MKYYIGEVNERNGEYENSSVIRFETDKEPEEYLRDICRFWYSSSEATDRINGEAEHELGNGWWHNSEVATFVGSYQEVTQEHYDALPYFISKIDVNFLTEGL